MSGFWDKTVSRIGGNNSFVAGGIDPEYNEQEQRFRNLEKRGMRLLQETKDYRGTIRNMTSAQQALSQNLSAFLLDIQRPQDYQAAYRQATQTIDQVSQPQFDEVFLHTVLQPMAQYCGYLPEFNKAIKKRTVLAGELDKARKALAKEQTKADSGGIERAEMDVQYAEEAFAVMNRTLVGEIPKLINARVYVVDPSFEAFVKAQLQFFNDSLRQMDGVTRYLPPSGGPQDDRVLDERIENVMSQVRSLTICSLNL